MYLDDFSNLTPLATQTGFIIFATQPEDPTALLPGIKNPIIISPDPKKHKITVDAVRQIDTLTASKQTGDFFIIINHAETMNTQAANALLKNLEEPGANYHFIFFTTEPSRLLPTIRSRAQTYYQRQPFNPADPPAASDETKRLAKELIVATPADLPRLADFYHKKKPDVRRTFALEVTSIAIEMLYKTYLIGGNPALLAKLRKFLTLHDALQAGGHVKLHIVADLC